MCTAYSIWSNEYQVLCGIYFVLNSNPNKSCLDVFIYWDSWLSLHSLVYSALHNLSWRDFSCLLILAMFPISDSTFCDKCSESCYYFQSWIPLGMAWNIPGRRETETEGAWDEFATLVCWLPFFELIGRSTAASRRRRETESSCSPVASLTRVLQTELPTAWELAHHTLKHTHTYKHSPGLWPGSV